MGYIFNYWEDDVPMNVRSDYPSLKEEILNSGLLSRAKWYHRVVLKAKKWMISQRVRAMTALRAGGWRAGGTFTKQIPRGSQMSVEHLFAIILYCDFGTIAAEFTGTFRLFDAVESVGSLTKRHSKFAHFGRLLTELVLDFGVNGVRWTEEKQMERFDFERGPFYCGMNKVLNVESFAICLKGPCSTSVLRIVALNFATEKGVILKINNDGVHAQRQCFFDCSWISKYPEESERLWIAGQKCLRIESIIIVKNNLNYCQMMRTFYLFDAMLSGVNVRGVEIKEQRSDFELLSTLIRSKLNSPDMMPTELDPYLMNQWDLFLQTKTTIHLKLKVLDKHFKGLSKLVMSNVVKIHKKKRKRNNLVYSVNSTPTRQSVSFSFSENNAELQGLWRSPSLSFLELDRAYTQMGPTAVLIMEQIMNVRAIWMKMQSKLHRAVITF